jgi:putative SOS response-associated peptidase YedK
VLESVEIRPRYNVAPTDEVPAVTTDREGHPRGELLRWGLVPSFAASPSDGAKMINARAETVAAKPAFRRSFQTMRCLLPAGGFYEWQRRGEGHKQPFHITVRDREIFAFAGIWAVWHAPDGNGTVRSCSILTTAANDAVAPLHDRMPVILPREAEAAWLAHDTRPDALAELMHGLPADAMAVREVSTRVNDVRYDGPACLADPETGELTPAETVQPSLF